jgi:dipeptidyl aminopeptidase/acylaminoacyl peptidase
LETTDGVSSDDLLLSQASQDAQIAAQAATISNLSAYQALQDINIQQLAIRITALEQGGGGGANSAPVINVTIPFEGDGFCSFKYGLFADVYVTDADGDVVTTTIQSNTVQLWSAS